MRVARAAESAALNDVELSKLPEQKLLNSYAHDPFYMRAGHTQRIRSAIKARQTAESAAAAATGSVAAASQSAADAAAALVTAGRVAAVAAATAAASNSPAGTAKPLRRLQEAGWAVERLVFVAALPPGVRFPTVAADSERLLELLKWTQRYQYVTRADLLAMDYMERRRTVICWMQDTFGVAEWGELLEYFEAVCGVDDDVQMEEYLSWQPRTSLVTDDDS